MYVNRNCEMLHPLWCKVPFRFFPTTNLGLLSQLRRLMRFHQYNSFAWYKPFLFDEDQHSDEKAEEEDHSDRHEDHGVDGVWVTCWVKTLELVQCIIS